MMGGLGDVLILGAALQVKGFWEDEVQELVTNPVMAPIFKDHPFIDLVKENGTEQQILWPSQIYTDPKIKQWNYHTMNRFASQVGVNLAPHDTLNIYNDLNIVEWDPNNESKTILINHTSAETTRRYIPKPIIDRIVKEAKIDDLEVIHIGSCHPGYESVTDIAEMMDLMTKCALFIGPVSFPMHLAGAIGVPTVAFFSYMPEHLFSHISRTFAVNPRKTYDCVLECERNELACRNKMDCHDRCKAVDYDIDEIERQIRRAIQCTVS